MRHHIELGQEGESLAAKHLSGLGYKILQTNYQTCFGEIDIVAKDQETICFVEVKTRDVLDQGHPLEAVTEQKQLRLAKAAQAYLKEHHLFDSPARFDVVAIILDNPKGSVELIQNAFEVAA